MPTVKGYTSQTELAPIQGGRTSAAPNPEIAAAAGKTVSKIGASIYQEEVQKQDEVAALEADRKLSEWESNRLYNPDSGALSRKGKDALGVPDEVNKDFDKFTGDLRSSMSNGRQQMVVDKLVESRRKGINETLSKHVYNEMQRFDDSETASYIKNSQQAASLNYNDPARIGEEIGRQETAITSYARRKGISGSETEKQMRTQAVSDTHVGVIERYLANGQDRAARNYFNGSGDAGASLIKTAPGLIEAGNIDLKKRPRVTNSDGSYSTVRSMSFSDGGQEVVIPTVVGNKVVSDDEAVAEYRKTGKFIAKFDTPENADKFANMLHGAQASFYGGAKNQIAGDDVIKIEAKLKTATTDGEAMRGVDDIWKDIGPKSLNDAVDQTKMADKLRDKYGDDPHVLKAALTVLRERATEHNSSQREIAESNASKVWGAVEKGSGLIDIRQMPEYLALPGHTQVQIKEHVADRANKRVRDESDMQAYYSLTQMAAADDKSRAEFANMNLYDKYRAKLSDADFKHFAALQMAVRKGDTKESDKLMASERVQKQIVDDALLSMKLDPTPNEKTGKTQLDQILGFRRSVRETVRQHEQQTGKNATDADVQGIVDSLLVKGKVPGTGVAGYFQTERRTFELKDGESLVVKRKDIPQAEARKIESALKRNGRQITDEAVTTMYQAKLLRMRGTAAPQAAQPAKPGDPKFVPN